MSIKQHHDHPAIPNVTLSNENLTDLVTFDVEFVRSMEAMAIEIINTVTALDQWCKRRSLVEALS